MAASGAPKDSPDARTQLPGHVAPVVMSAHEPLQPSNVGGTNKSGCVCCCALARSCVSLKKRRFVQDGYDLDLAYVTDRVIAMGFPSHGVEACYRNPYEDERRFLDERHNGKYKVYNLCGEAERQYDPALFYGRASVYGWLDHEACPFDMMFEACGDAAAFLAQDPQHVVALHCKAGKGRTGLMACCLLLHLGVCASPRDAMQLYATRRTFNGKGLTIPSQKRYVCCYALQLQAIRQQFAQRHGEEHTPSSGSANEADTASVAALTQNAQSDAVPVAQASAAAQETEPQAESQGQAAAETGDRKAASDQKQGTAADDASTEAVTTVQVAPAADEASVANPTNAGDAARQRTGSDSAGSVHSAASVAGATFGPWAPDMNSTTVPNRTARLMSICIRGRSMGHSHVGVALYKRVSGSLQRELVVRCPPQPYGASSAPGVQPLPSAGMPASLFQGMDVPSTLTPDDNCDLRQRDAPLSVGHVRAEDDLTVWQGVDVLGDTGVHMAATDYLIVITGHASRQAAGKKIAAAWVHPAFLPADSIMQERKGMLSLPKGALDKVFKDKKHQAVSSHFALHLLYFVEAS